MIPPASHHTSRNALLSSGQHIHDGGELQPLVGAHAFHLWAFALQGIKALQHRPVCSAEPTGPFPAGTAPAGDFGAVLPNRYF